MMKRVKILLLLLPFVLNCSSQDDSEFDRQYNLETNNCFDVNGTEYNLCLESVNDSRCPTDLVCIWEGNAAANFILNSKTDSKPFTLNTNQSFQRDTILNRLKIELVRVSPYPITTATNQNEYSVTIKISKE